MITEREGERNGGEEREREGGTRERGEGDHYVIFNSFYNWEFIVMFCVRLIYVPHTVYIVHCIVYAMNNPCICKPNFVHYIVYIILHNGTYLHVKCIE